MRPYLPHLFWTVSLVLLAWLPGCQSRLGDPVAEPQCGSLANSIQSIQGLGPESTHLGTKRTVEAVVTHWMTQKGGNVIYLQDHHPDPQNLASSGLFVDLSELDVADPIQPGRLLRVVGTVSERDGQTGLMAEHFSDCGQQDMPAARVVTQLPPLSGDLENLEGMRVDLQLPLTIADLYWIGSAGRFSVSSGGRLYAPTEVVLPGPAARQMATQNRARTLSVTAPQGTIDAQSLPRSGDRLIAAQGVLGHWRGNYQLFLSQPPRFEHLNERSPAPARQGSLRVSSFNVLNYFNGDGQGGGFPTPRGASSPVEFERQQAKIVAAMLAIDADIFSLAEIENDGYDPSSAINQLTTALNKSGTRRYEFARPPENQLGQGLIAVGLLYDPSIVHPNGQAMTITEPPFDRRHRPPLLQHFTHIASSRPITIVALHLKSKRCNDPKGANKDLGDGQGCWNAARAEAAVSLADWVKGHTGSGNGVDSILMLGDYNAHTMEDPLRALTESGLVNVMTAPPPDYSFMFQGQSGSLDHGFASPKLVAIAHASVWHINADEPPWRDYNLEFKSAKTDARLYRRDAFRSSDHDPLIIDLSF